MNDTVTIKNSNSITYEIKEINYPVIFVINKDPNFIGALFFENGIWKVYRDTLKSDIKFNNLHNYSSIISEEPWKTIEINLNNLKDFKTYKVIDVTKLEQDVKNFLRTNLTQKLWDFCVKSQSDWINDYETNVKESLHLQYHQEVTIMPYICFTGAQYIAELFTTDKSLWSKMTEHTVNHKKYQFKEINMNEFPKLRGIWHCSLDNNQEGHGFVLSINEDKITVYNTYGGVEGIFITEFDRIYWTNLFVNFFNLSVHEQKKLYHMIWGLNKEHISLQWDEPLEFQGFQGCQLY